MKDISIVSKESRSSIGGLATYTRELARGLVKVGGRVTAISQFDRDQPGRLDYATGTTGAGRSVNGIPTQLVGPSDSLRPLLRQLTRINSLPSLRPWGVRLFNLAYNRSLAEAMPADVDVVHYVGTGWELLGYTAHALARRRRAAFTVLPAVHPGSWGDGAMDVELYRRADAVFVLSNHEAEHLVAHGVPRRLLVKSPLAPAAAPTGDGQRLRDHHHLGRRPVILFVGPKVRSKGFHTLAEAMIEVLIAVPDACLLALGPDGEPPYPQVPAGAHLDLGRVDEVAKADALAACDVFCMPSSAESFGIVYVEAWSYGKPVVGGPAPAARELIEDGVTGFTVNEQRPATVAAALIRLLTDPALRDRLGTAGRELQRSRYNWPAVVNFHLQVFGRVAAQH